ncbi:MAG: class I SAM-dependent methyltransferase [Thermodesulfobacteriota bacterium]|nr:class I SAM-dependent methyltransferase [Thermodesulfobacteriota bacterium]
MDKEKLAVHDFWERASCGEELYLKDGRDREAYLTQAKVRYTLEPFIPGFAEFHLYKGERVLEIGVGLGADHLNFAEAGADLYGIDLTPRALRHTLTRMELFGLRSHLMMGDAEQLSFADSSFDLVYSWGVLHHTPDTARAVAEVYRVLKPGGEAKIMIYHKHSFVGYMLWCRYAFLALKPWLTLEEIYGRYLESPGTKAYSEEEAQHLFRQFRSTDIQIVLGHGDLLTSAAGQRHQGVLLSIARTVWPRWVIRTFFPKHGLFMLIRAVK